MKKTICFVKKLFCLLFLLIVCEKIKAQDTTIYQYQFDSLTLYRIELDDGSELIGEFLHRTRNEIFIRTGSLPKIEIPVNRIKKITEIRQEEFRNGEYWFRNPNPTRYFFAPSAYNLRKGEGYYQNSYIIFNSFNFGITNYFSLGGTLEILSTFSTDMDPIFFVTPKVGVEVSDSFHVGVGILYAQLGEEGSGGILYGLTTFGSIEKNLTTGLGWGFIDGEFSRYPMFNINGIARLSRKTSFVSENWIFPNTNSGSYAIFSYGLRFFGETIAVDLAFINNGDIIRNILIGFPYVDFVVKF